MKRITIVIFLLISIIVLCACENKQEKYLRIHIRANSNSKIDQEIKYEVRDLVVCYLQEKLIDVKDKEDAKNIVIKESDNLKILIDTFLKERSLNYVSNLSINKEYFPTKSYENTTLESGVYDAVIISLGEGLGDNWWCVVFPPLCFKAKPNASIKCRSLFKEIFYKLK